MLKKIFVFFLIILTFFFIYNYLQNQKKNENLISEEENTYNSNLLENVNYVATDEKGNEYIIYAEQGEIDLNDTSVIFLKNVKSEIKIKDSDSIYITSSYGKYNSSNYNTIFSKNVVIDYTENKIKSEYLDFSLAQNRMIISKNVVYTNLENILKADVVEVNIKTKDTKIYMYEENKKVNIKNKDFPDGNN